MLYLLKIAIFSTMPFAYIAKSKRITFDLMQAAWGMKGSAFAALTVFTSGIAVLNAQMLGYPRVLSSLSHDGLSFSPTYKAGGRSVAPIFSPLTITVLAGILVFSGSYSDILGYSAFVSQLFMAVVVAAVIVLIIRRPDIERPYRVWGYPFTPVVLSLS